MLRRLFLDPLAIKELSGNARRWQTYAGRGLYVAVFGFVLWTFADRFSQRNGRMSQSEYAGLGRELFQVFFVFQMIFATLSAVSAASDLVTKEVRAGTLSILTCSPLTPRRIAFGKWKAAFAQACMLILCGAPILAFCVYLGGATPWDLSYSLSITCALAGLGAAAALYFSTRFRSGVTALLVSCGLMAAYAFLPAAYMDYRTSDSLIGVLTHHTHLVDAASVALKGGRRGTPDSARAWISAVLLTGILVWGILRRTAARIAVIALLPPGPSLMSRLFVTLDRFYEDISPRRIRGIRLLSSRDGVWESRAVLWKELQTRASGRLRNSVRISLVLLLILAGSLWVGFEAMPIPILLSTALLWLLALSNGASLFVTEKEERKWDILLATPLTSTQILGAKLVAGLVPVLPSATAIALFWAAIVYTHHLQGPQLVVVIGAVFAPAALAYTLGAVCSLKAHSLRGAFLLAFSILAGLMAVLPTLHFILSAGSIDPGWYTPAPSLFWLCNRGLSNWRPSVPDQLFWNCILMQGLYGTGLTLLLVYVFGRFDRIAGRSD